MKTATIEKIASILNHKRAETGWVVRADTDSDGKPCIVRMARIVCIWPVDGAGRLTVAVSDWGLTGCDEVKHYAATANGYGYDKFTAATAGMTIGGIALGDHCDRAERGTFRTVVNNNDWEAFNIPCGW